MLTLTVTARGQITVRKNVLQHLGVKPGQKIRLDLLPDGRAALSADKPSQTIDSFIGLLAGKSKRVATICEMNEAISEGWSGKQSSVESKPK